ncbi:MAG: toprim domain-containing protein [Bacteroidales bacterium]|nr:toprim domain-containing protein [Bacteroidales bacterium]MBW6479336.1 toprim domain-containing protein [Bacteroidales bacterium]
MEIREIKQRLSILTVLNHYGLKPDKNGMVKCPFHQDDKPSMKIYPATNTFNCFGCDKNGDQVEFCTLKEGDKHKGILKATALTGEIKPMNNKPKQQESQPKPKQNHTETLTKFFTYFQNNLNHPVALKPKEYLKSRNLNHELLEMGYNSGQFHHRGKLTEAEQQACVKAGLLVPYASPLPHATGATYTPFARECIIFPLLNKQNQVVSLYGRSIINNDKSKHYYLKDRQGLYPCHPKPETTRLILTEAIIDAATLLQIPEISNQYGILACYGTNGLTDEHREAIKQLQSLQEIIFFFDGDKAGRDAIKKYQEELLNELPGVKLTAIETPESEDINSLLQGHEGEIFTHLLENREPFSLTETVLTEERGNDTQVPQEPTGTIKEPVLPSGKLNTRNPEFITYTTDELQIILLGGINLGQIDRLRITIKISRTDTGDPLHSIRHTLDLYHSDYLEKFINKASEQLETSTSILKRAIAELTEQIEQYRLTKIESMKEQKPQARQLTEERKNRAIRYLKAPNLLQRTNEDIGKTGVIGEEINRLLMYLVFTSRLREQPLHIVSLGASGTGKTYLQEKVSELIPEQDKLEITILSENAFYYFDRKELKHKLVLIEDMDGAQEVLYPLRELQTKRKISKTIPIKDSKGNLRTITLHVEGPICLAGTTTRERLYEDNANRSLLIYIDNSQEHKELIMDYQRKLSAGKIDSRTETNLKEFFKNMQSVLKPVKVRNPYAELLKLPEYVFKPLRTNSHYLACIETISFYCQYQRTLKTDPATGETYIETTLEDIEWANKLLKDVLLAKSDELSGECRSFFERLKTWIKTGQRTSFFASQIRESFRMNPNNLKYYLIQLTRYGYIKPVGGDRYKRGFEYEVVNFDEYNKLNTSINSVFDEVLARIKNKNKTSG